MDDDNDTDATLGKILEFLENIVSPDDLEIVQALFAERLTLTRRGRRKPQPAAMMIAGLAGRPPMLRAVGRCRHRPRTFTRGCFRIKGGWRECRIKTEAV